MSDQVRLQPVQEADIDVIDRLTGDPESTGEFGWFGWFDQRAYRRRWAENRLFTDDSGILMVVRGDQRLGFVAWHKRPTTRTSYCWNMGIAMLPEARGQGYGTEAHRLLARYLFAHTTIHRIEADTEVDNVAEQKALESAGFTREGVLRGGGWRDGAWRDGVIYSILRTDLPA